MIPYSHQSISADDIDAVSAVLGSERLTQGEKVEEFEAALAHYCSARFAVVTSSGTAALHTAYHAAGLGKGDEIITSPLTFPATANAALWQGARPVFADVDPESGNIEPNDIKSKISERTKAIVLVDYAGRPCDIDRVREIVLNHNLILIEDGCQALGAQYKDQQVGSLSDMTVFSFHPVKSITTGEGGAVLTDNEAFYKAMKSFVTHGVVRDNFKNKPHGDWYFEQQDLGFNYRLTDFQCALGINQLKKLDDFIEKRRTIAARYTEAFSDVKEFELPPMDDQIYSSAWHLYVIRFTKDLVDSKAVLFKMLRAKGIGVQVHHIPVHLHPYYQKMGFKQGLLPKAEQFYASALSLPLYPDLTGEQQSTVIDSVLGVINDVRL